MSQKDKTTSSSGKRLSLPAFLSTRALWFVFVTALVTSANSVLNGFVYDDVVIIRDNPLVNGPFDLSAIFSTNYWFRLPDRDALYRPITILSFALENAIFGMAPSIVHWSNILLNAFVGMALWVLSAMLFGSKRIALIASLLFVTMPLHSEVVANGVGRSELLAALFSLLALINFFSLCRGRSADFKVVEKHPIRGMALSGVFYFLAMSSKESAVILPAVLVLIDWLIIGGGSSRFALRAIPRYLAFLLPLAGYFAMRYAVVGIKTPEPHELLIGASSLERFLIGFQAMMGYVHQFIIPSGFSADYHDYRALPRPKLSDLRVCLSLAAFAGIFAVCVQRAVKKDMLPLVALGWFVISLFPTSNLLVAIGTLRGDRLAYFPSIGFALAGAWLLLSLRSIEASLPIIAFNIVLFAQVFISIDRNADWQSKESLWKRAVSINPGSADGWRNVGDIYADRNQLELARAAYERSKQLKHQLRIFNAPATLLLAKTLTRMGRIDEAAQQYQEVLRRYPRHLISMISLGQLYLQDPTTADEALAVFDRATEVFPKNFHSFAHKAEALKNLERFEEALATVNHALSLNDRWPYVWAIKAQILSKLGRAEEAAAAREKAGIRRPSEPKKDKNSVITDTSQPGQPV